MQLHELKRKNPHKKHKTVGRGGKRGKTAGRGTKGQNARAGHKKRPEMRDIIKKLPKRRGYGKNRGRTVVGDRPSIIPIPLTQLEQIFDAATEINLKSLAERLSYGGRGTMPVKIVGGSVIQKKLNVKGVP